MADSSISSLIHDKLRRDIDDEDICDFIETILSIEKEDITRGKEKRYEEALARYVKRNDDHGSR